MSEPPAQGGEWRPIADQIAVNVKNFIDGVDALARGGGDETVPMLLLEMSQILLENHTVLDHVAYAAGCSPAIVLNAAGSGTESTTLTIQDSAIQNSTTTGSE